MSIFLWQLSVKSIHFSVCKEFMSFFCKFSSYPASLQDNTQTFLLLSCKSSSQSKIKLMCVQCTLCNLKKRIQFI